MKNLIIAALLAVSISSFSQEQNRGEKKSNREQLSPEQQGKVYLDKMIKELELNTSQQEQIKPIIAELVAKKNAIRAERMGNDSKKMSKDEKKALQTKRVEDQKTLEAKFQAILTPEQFAKMKANEEVNKERMRYARESWEKKNDINDRDNINNRNNIETN